MLIKLPMKIAVRETLESERGTVIKTLTVPMVLLVDQTIVPGLPGI